MHELVGTRAPRNGALLPLLSLVYDHAPAAMCLTRVGDSVFLDANDHMLEMLGYDRDELVGHSAHELGIWRDPPRPEIMDEIRRTGRARNTELTFYSKDGSKRVCLASLDAVVVEGVHGIVSVCVDITRRKAIEETQGRLLTAIESAADAIMTVGRDARILTWNKGAERIFGYSAAEIVGQPGSILLPRDLPDEGAVIQKSLQATGALLDHETTRLRKDGTTFDASVSVSLARDASGEIIGYTGVIRDITERKRLEQQARRDLVAKPLVRRMLTHFTKQGSATSVMRRELGRSLASETGTDAIASGLEAFEAMGIGELRVVRNDGERFEFRGGNMLDMTPGAAVATCQFALGFAEGIVRAHTHRDALGAEVRCQSQGHPECVFVIRAR